MSKTATPMSRGLRIDAHRLVILLAIVLSQFTPNGSIAAEDPGKAQQDQAPPSGTVPVVGSLVFWRTSKVATPVTGRIASLPVRVGGHVKKGEVVAQIDTEQLKANLSVAQSRVINARAQLAVAEAQLVSQTTVRDRLAKLKGTPAFRAASLEDANNAVLVASAAVEAAKSRIEVTEAEVARQQVNVNLATIGAPFDGVVVRHLLTVGGLVTSRQHRSPVFCVAVSPGRLKVLDDGISMNLIQLRSPHPLPSSYCEFERGAGAYDWVRGYGAGA